MIINRADALECLDNLRAFIEVRCAKDAPPPLPEHVPTPVDVVGLQVPDAFYDHIRGDAGELFPKMSQSQYDGVQMTLTCGAGLLPLSWCAYVLATEYHETARRMQAVREGLDVSDAWRRKHLRYYPWYGRGEVQLTWERNYRHATERLRAMGHTDVDLIANPDQALDPKISTLIMIHGMLEGWFTGKRLRDYIPASADRKHYFNARRIVNILDKADLIAGYAEAFETGLVKGVWK